MENKEAERIYIPVFVLKRFGEAGNGQLISYRKGSFDYRMQPVEAYSPKQTGGAFSSVRTDEILKELSKFEAETDALIRDRIDGADSVCLTEDQQDSLLYFFRIVTFLNKEQKFQQEKAFLNFGKKAKEALSSDGEDESGQFSKELAALIACRSVQELNACTAVRERTKIVFRFMTGGAFPEQLEFFRRTAGEKLFIAQNYAVEIGTLDEEQRPLHVASVYPVSPDFAVAVTVGGETEPPQIEELDRALFRPPIHSRENRTVTFTVGRLTEEEVSFLNGLILNQSEEEVLLSADSIQ